MKQYDMKKILYLLLFIPFGLSAQTATMSLSVGTTANDGTGTPLRTFAIMTKTDFAAVRDSLANIYREVQVLQKINDSLNALRAAATPLGDIAALTVDTLTWLPTMSDLANIEGGGGTSGKFYILSGKVNDLGFPDTGDTSMTHTNFPGKHITLFRRGRKIEQNPTNARVDTTFRVTDGIVYVKPAFQDDEQIEIWSTNTIQWEGLTAEGGGGEAESSLLTGLRAGWKLDEVSGNAINDVLGVYNGTTTGTVNAPGKFGVAESFVAASSQYGSLGNAVGDCNYF